MKANYEPWKALFSVNPEILFLTSDIAYHLGRLSVTSTHGYSKKDALDNASSCFELLGMKIKPSQKKGLLLGEDIPSQPRAKAIYDLYQDILKFDPYEETSLERVEQAYFPEGVPHRMSKELEGYAFPLPTYKRIPSLMKGLFRFASSRTSNPITLGALFCFVLTAIAPYSKDNLAIGLFYFHAFLCRYAKNLSGLNLYSLYIKNSKEIEDAYYASCEKMDMSEYILCWMKLLRRSVSSLLLRSVKGDGKTSPMVSRLLEKMEDGRYYSCAELLELLGLKSRLGLQKNYLRPALESKLIAMSNPLVKTDRNQRYIKKGE